MTDTDAVDEPEAYRTEDVFDQLSRGDTIDVETTGTAGDQSFTGTVLDTHRDHLFDDADAIYIDVREGDGHWTLHAERSSSDEDYGPLYADGASAGQRVESIEEVTDT